MTPDELKERTKAFSLAVLKIGRSLPTDPATREMTRQLVRAGTSVGANYRSGCRARSDREFIAKLGVVEDEADETMFWLELLVDDGLLKSRQVSSLLDEADQIVRIMVASIRTARLRRAKKRESRKARLPSASGNHSIANE